MKRAGIVVGVVVIVVAAVVGFATVRARGGAGGGGRALQGSRTGAARGALAERERPRSAGDAATATGGLAVAEVKGADFTITLPVEGVLEAARSLPIVNLARDTQIVWVLSDGVQVKAGDIVMKLNPTQVKKDFDRLQNEVAQAEEKVRQSRAAAEKGVQNARSSLAKAEEGLRLAVVEAQAGIEKAQAELTFLEKEVEVAQGQLDKRKRLLEERLMPITEVEAAEDELREKQFSLEAARRTLDRAKVDADTTKRLREMDVQTAKLELEQAEANLVTSVASAQRDLAQKQSDLQESQEQLDSMEVKAPVEGMLLLDQTWEDGWRPLRVGDQVWEGQKIANIIDPSEMWVRCDISEADIELVKVGQRAEVRVPAIGPGSLTGEIKSVDNLARERSPWEGGSAGRKVFAAAVRLTSNNSKLRPGMGGTVDIVLERVRRGVAVPLESLFAKGDGYIVYRAEGQGYREVPVKVLKRNNALAAVEGELKKGDAVARERPPAELAIASGDRGRNAPRTAAGGRQPK